MINAIVLAGGFGTRLAGVSQGLPKPLVDVAGRPFIEYVLDSIVAAGIETIALAVSYRWELIRQHLGSRYRNATLEYCVEETPLGTGGGILQCMRQAGFDRALVLNGDTLFRIDLADLQRRHVLDRAQITMALLRSNDTSRYGVVERDETGIVTAFRSGGAAAPGAINGGIYVVERTAFTPFELPTAFSFERDFLERHVRALHPLGVEYEGYFIDIGIPDDLQRARNDLAHSS